MYLYNIILGAVVKISCIQIDCNFDKQSHLFLNTGALIYAASSVTSRDAAKDTMPCYT